MSADAMQGLDNIQPNAKNFYREELYTDLEVASIRRLIPVKTDGSDDDTREQIFIAQTQIMSPAGQLPINSPIEAKTLTEAIEKFPDAVKIGVEKIMEEVREYQRQEAGKIVVPGQSGGGKLHL